MEEDKRGGEERSRRRPSNNKNPILGYGEKTNGNRRFWPLGALLGGILEASWGVLGGLVGSLRRIVGRWRSLEVVLGVSGGRLGPPGRLSEGSPETFGAAQKPPGGRALPFRVPAKPPGARDAVGIYIYIYTHIYIYVYIYIYIYIYIGMLR